MPQAGKPQTQDLCGEGDADNSAYLFLQFPGVDRVCPTGRPEISGLFSLLLLTRPLSKAPCACLVPSGKAYEAAAGEGSPRGEEL